MAAQAEYRFEVSAEGFDPYLSLPVDVALPDRRQLTIEVFEPFVNSIGMAFARIPAGTFLMGDIQGVGYGDELPVHEVTLTKDFYIGKYEVTQAQWEAVMGNNPSWFSSCGGDCPVEWVSWEEAQAFVEALNALEGTTAYRLPTEAEWEYAARAGTTTSYAFGDDENRLDDYAWTRDNSGRRTQPVGQKKPNLWGLYDIHGNMFEWVQDWYKSDYYLLSLRWTRRGRTSVRNGSCGEQLVLQCLRPACGEPRPRCTGLSNQPHRVSPGAERGLTRRALESEGLALARWPALKHELVRGCRFNTRARAQHSIFAYIECDYKP